MAETRGGGRQKITRAKESQTQLEGLPEKLAGEAVPCRWRASSYFHPKNGSTALNQPDAKQKTYKTTVKRLESRPVHSQMHTMQLS